MRTTRLLVPLFVAGILLAACGGDDSSSSDTTTKAADVTTTADAGTASATVELQSNAELGKYLVDAEGNTLYLFEKDTGTTSACTGACANTWPAYVATGSPTVGDGLTAADLSTANGSEPNQVTYHGHLLYHFAGDSAPGDTNGTKIPSWYAVGPDGNSIEND